MSTAPLRKQSAPVLVSQPPVPSYSSSGSRPRDSIDRSVNASSPSSKPASTQTAGASSSARANAIAREQRRIAKKSAENLRISVGTSASYSNNLSGSYQASQAPPASSTKTFKRSIGASSSNRKLTSAREAGSTSLVTSNTSLQNNASNSTSLNHLPSTTRSETLESSSNVNGKSAVSSAANPDASHTMPRLDSDPLAVPPSNAQRQRKPSVLGLALAGLKIGNSATSSRSTSGIQSTIKSSSKRSDDDLSAATQTPQILTKRLSLRDQILDKFSPKRGRSPVSSPDGPPSAAAGNRYSTSDRNLVRLKAIEEPEQYATTLPHAPARLSVDSQVNSYYNPARGMKEDLNYGNAAAAAASRRASVNTHVFVDRAHLVFESEPSSVRSSKVSVYTRRPSLHSEVEEILRISVPKRSSALKYLFNKQPATPRGLVGLANLGNTCFMNSVLQCIFATELLMGYFLSGDYISDLNNKSPMKGQLAKAFVSVLDDALKPTPASSTRVLNPSRFKRQIETWAPQFAGYSQQDAQEFLRFMLDGLHEDLNRVSVRPRFTYKDADVDKLSDVDKARFAWHRYHAGNCSLIFDLFGGQLQSTVTCHSCGHPSVTFDTFWDLSLPIPKSSGDDPVSKCSLSDCLAEFAAKELLDELYRCDNCKNKVRASKRLQIYKCPEVLVLHLKRFAYSRYSRDKIDTSVKFPLRRLSLDPIMSSTPGHDQIVYYDLFGISNHMGGLGGGHYIAHTKSWDTGLWYEKNDSGVTEVDEGRIESGLGRSSYVLFFQKSRSGT